MSRLYAFLLLLVLTASAAVAQVEGIGYRLAPAGSYVFFDRDAALTDGLLYGGGGGLSFGEFLELNGSYVLGSDFETDFSDLSGTDNDPALAAALAALPARNVDLERYGAEIKLNLGTGAVVPFLTGGAGVIRFSPQGAESSRSLYLLGGAGLQFVLADRFGLALSGNAFGYRYNPGTAFFTPADFAAVGLNAADFNNTEVLNPSVRAALSIYLGGRRPGQLSDLDREFQRQFAGGLSGLSIVAEPFYARTDFDDAFNYSDQSFAGVEAGFDVGPLVGLRGFYGRGVDSGDPTDFEDIQMYGGDLRLRLNSGGGFIPFITVGAGYLDVRDGYADTFDPDPTVNRALAESRPFALGGAGLEVPFGRRLRAIGEVRALAMSVQDIEDNTSTPDDVYLSPTYRVGLSFGLGGSSGSRTEVVTAEQLATERLRLQAELDAQQADAAQREAELLAEIQEARLDGDAEAVARLQAERAGVIARAAAQPTVAPAGTVGAVGANGVATSLPTPVRTSRGERIVTIPLPETGELYVRYGEPGGVSIESSYEGTDGPRAAASGAQPALSPAELREIVRETVRESLADQSGEVDQDEIERRVEDRIADRLGSQLRDDRSSGRDLDDVERRLEDRISSEMAQIRELLRYQQQQPAYAPAPAYAPPGVPVAPGAVTRDSTVISTPSGPVVVPTTSTPEVPRDLRRRGLYSFSPTIGLGVGESSNLFAGLRAEIASGGALTYVPEILVGVTGRRAFAANFDATVGFPVESVSAYGSPYGRIGIGVVNTGSSDSVPETFEEDVDDGGTALTFNLGLGADLTYGGGRFFVDFTTGNLGKYNRLTAGYRFPFGGRLY